MPAVVILKASNIRKLRVHLWVPAIKKRHFANGLHEFCAAVGDQFGDHGSTIITLRKGELHFDQFVIGKCAVKFCEQIFGDAVLRNGDHWVKMVANATKCFLLCL